MKAQHQIIKKLAPRYFAQFVTSRGTIGSKGFCTRELAARHAAKEWLLDQLHGEKEYTSTPSGEHGWYQRDWDIERMKWIFNCQWISECGIHEHRFKNYDWNGCGYDEIHCTEDGKAFCALTWTSEVRRIAKLIMSGEELFLSWWVIERLNSYVRAEAVGQEAFDVVEVNA